MEHTSTAHAILAADGSVLFANPALYTLSGRGGTSLLGVPFQELLSKGGRMFYETQLTSMLLLRGAVSGVSLEVLSPNGSTSPVFVSAVVVPGQEEGTRYIIITLFEATQRKHYEDELLRSRRELEQLAEVVRRSSDAIFRLSENGNIQSWNKGAELIFGLTSSRALGLPLAAIFAEEHREDLLAVISHMKRGREVTLEMRALHNDGRQVEVDVALTPHMEAPGILVAFSAVIRDSTSRKRTEKALLQNEKLASVGRLASSIAHEINNPLEAVTNLLYILEKKITDHETKSFVHLAQEELARVSQIATHTLRFHKQSTGRTSLDLSALTESVLGLYRARLKNQQITATNDSMRVSPLLCFEGELRQILVNLVANAFDAMRTGGRLTIRNRDIKVPSSGQSGVRITVADTGSGMDEETRARLFEPFFSTKGIGGTGLGLWITHDLVRKNGGTIRVRSSHCSPNRGTVVSMTFPRLEPKSEP